MCARVFWRARAPCQCENDSEPGVVAADAVVAVVAVAVVAVVAVAVAVTVAVVVVVVVASRLIAGLLRSATYRAYRVVRVRFRGFFSFFFLLTVSFFVHTDSVSRGRIPRPWIVLDRTVVIGNNYNYDYTNFIEKQKIKVFGGRRYSSRWRGE